MERTVQAPMPWDAIACPSGSIEAVRDDGFDVFLSHAAADAPMVDQAREALRAAGIKVYVDRFDDPQLDRTKVSWETAEKLRTQMRRSRLLVLAVTQRSAQSKWIPWELGFFDGKVGEVLVYPLDASVAAGSSGQEYLGLYEVLDPDTAVAAIVARVGRLRDRYFSSADVADTGGFGKRAGEMLPRLMQDPMLALCWQGEIAKAGLELTRSWWVSAWETYTKLLRAGRSKP